MRSEGPDTLYIEEAKPALQCRHCRRIFDAGEEVLEVRGDLFCDQDCINKQHAYLEDKYWDVRFDEYRDGER